MAADSLMARAGVTSLRITTLQSHRRNWPIHHCPFAYSLVVFVYLNRRFPPVEINTREFKALRRRRAKKTDDAARNRAIRRHFSSPPHALTPVTSRSPNKTARRRQQRNRNLLRHEVGGLKNQHCFAV